MTTRARGTAGRAAALPLAFMLTLGCNDTVEPPAVPAPWNAIDTQVTITRLRVQPLVDTAVISYTFTNRAATDAALVQADGCPRIAAGVVVDQVVHLLTPICGVDGFTADSVTQTFTVPANGTKTVQVPFTGVVSIGVPARCAPVGQVTLVMFAVDGQDVTVLPTVAGGRVTALAMTEVVASTDVPTC